MSVKGRLKELEVLIDVTDVANDGGEAVVKKLLALPVEDRAKICAALLDGTVWKITWGDHVIRP